MWCPQGETVGVATASPEFGVGRELLFGVSDGRTRGAMGGRGSSPWWEPRHSHRVSRGGHPITAATYCTLVQSPLSFIIIASMEYLASPRHRQNLYVARLACSRCLCSVHLESLVSSSHPLHVDVGHRSVESISRPRSNLLTRNVIPVWPSSTSAKYPGQGFIVPHRCTKCWGQGSSRDVVSSNPERGCVRTA